MEYLVDTCIWVDHLRKNSSPNVRTAATRVVNRLDMVSCEPICFELLRMCPRESRAGIERRLKTVPMLPTPASLWPEATVLGQQCQDKGIQAAAADLIIAAITKHYEATLVTFDRHFAHMARTLDFKLELIRRPD